MGAQVFSVPPAIALGRQVYQNGTFASLTAPKMSVLPMGTGKPGEDYFADIAACIGQNVLAFAALFIGCDVRFI